MRSSEALAAILLMAAVPLQGAQKARKDVTCASCHREQTGPQPTTSMARALELPGANPVLKARPKLTFQGGAYSYRVDTRGDQSTYSISDGTNSISIPIRWTFGAKAQTYVLEYHGKLYESLVSYYPAIGGLDITIGDQKIHPQTLIEALGRELSDGESRACFECHSTGAVVHERLNLDVLTPGVQCERCHSGAGQHLQNISQHKLALPPQKLGQLTPEETSNFCGQCHRTWDRVVRDHYRGEVNVRFQPYRLANSKCYDGGDRRLSCTVCHDPHREVSSGADAYDAKCLACHGSSAQAPSAKPCPVERSGCVTCHMPKVALPGGHMTLTDHQIRIVRAGEPYPN